MGFAPQILMHPVNGKDNDVNLCKETFSGVVDIELLHAATVKHQ